MPWTNQPRGSRPNRRFRLRSQCRPLHIRRRVRSPASAPPCTRISSPLASRSCRSRRIVSSDTARDRTRLLERSSLYCQQLKNMAVPLFAQHSATVQFIQGFMQDSAGLCGIVSAVPSANPTSLPRGTAVRNAWIATLALFLAHGLVFATSDLADSRHKIALHLSNATLGLALLGAAVGSVTAIPIAGIQVTKYGSRLICILSTLCFCLAIAAPGLAFNFWTLFLGLALFGATAGTMDVAMNAQGVLVEECLGKPTMSRFHAMFSLGAMAGAAGRIGRRPARPRVTLSGSWPDARSAVRAGRLESPRIAPTGRRTGGPPRPAAQYAHHAARSQRNRVLHPLKRRSHGRLDRRLPAGRPSTQIPPLPLPGMPSFRPRWQSSACWEITSPCGSATSVPSAMRDFAATGLFLALAAPSASLAMPGFGAAGCGFCDRAPRLRLLRPRPRRRRWSRNRHRHRPRLHRLPGGSARHRLYLTTHHAAPVIRHRCSALPGRYRPLPGLSILPLKTQPSANASSIWNPPRPPATTISL